jgi:hypothetical protein
MQHPPISFANVTTAFAFRTRVQEYQLVILTTCDHHFVFPYNEFAAAGLAMKQIFRIVVVLASGFDDFHLLSLTSIPVISRNIFALKFGIALTDFFSSSFRLDHISLQASLKGMVFR